MRLKKLLSFVTALALLVGATALPAMAEDGSSTGKTVTLAGNWEFSSGFYPVLTASNSSNMGFGHWSANAYETLVSYNADGQIAGKLATDWAVSEDGLTYTFTLRSGVLFSDGTPLTAAAVKTSFENAIINLGQYNGSYGRLTSLITSMDTPDDSTFIMTLSSPYYGAMNDLTMTQPLSIVSPTAFADGASAYDTCKNQTLGTGAYQYAGDFDGTTYTLIRNPHYWGEAPEVDSFKIKVITDSDAKMLALRSGEVDAIIGSVHMSYDAYTELSGDPAYGTALNTHSSMTRYLGMNLSKAPFNDVLVRQAVNHALNREAICASVFQGVEMPAQTIFPNTLPNCDLALTTYAYDVEKAKALMEEAGWVDTDGDGVREKNGETLVFPMTYTTDYGALDDAALVIASELKAIGFSITPQGTDMLSWFGSITSGECVLTIYGTYGGAYDPNAVMSNMNPAVSTDPVAVQFSPLVDASASLIPELDSTGDPARVQEIYAEVLTAIADQALTAPFSYTREYAAWSSAVIAGYTFPYDSQYIDIARIHLVSE